MAKSASKPAKPQENQSNNNEYVAEDIQVHFLLHLDEFVFETTELDHGLNSCAHMSRRFRNVQVLLGLLDHGLPNLQSRLWILEVFEDDRKLRGPIDLHSNGSMSQSIHDEVAIPCAQIA